MKKFLLIGILILISSCTSDDVATTDCRCGEVIDYHYDELAPEEPRYLIVRNYCDNTEQTFLYNRMINPQITFPDALITNEYCHYTNW